MKYCYYSQSRGRINPNTEQVYGRTDTNILVSTINYKTPRPSM